MRRLSPANIAWQRDLYSYPDSALDPWQAQALETHFFSPLDYAAANCMAKLSAGDLDGWTSKERQSWTMFLLAFFHRTPEHLEATKTKIREMYHERVHISDAQYEALRQDDDPATFSEWRIRHLDSDYAEKAVFRLLAASIDNENVGTFIMNSQWGVVDLSASDHPLLISDNPTILRPLKLDMGHIALPIAPRKLFISSHDRRLFDHLRRDHPKAIVRTANRLIVENANTFVGAIDRGSAAFIAKHYGQRRLGSLATGFTVS